ncbi:vWA domain-containing protein [Chondromyces crocatus]|uniref:VWFA domain-containing protein n=1 Tax=Chondromyces crocatus TaxID=52 RepID=A0A0K1ECY4_CHOCO|nr:VWA domain-containing protein [Chondromyces crocatus]AKT38731.1 uncharacterized protein CMC5_028750 [Chondromyces crocatus]
MSSTTHSSARSDVTRSAAAGRAIEIVIAWGETVLHVAHHATPRPFDLGEARPDGRPCDCFLPEQVLGTLRLALVFHDDRGRAHLALPASAEGTLLVAGTSLTTTEARARYADHPVDGLDGAVAIPLDELDALDVDLGGVHLKLTASQPLEAHDFKPRASRRTLGLVALSALAHAAAIGAFALAPPAPPSDDEGPTADQIFLMQQYLAAASEREMEETETEEVALPGADNKEGGMGTRARGEEGSAGSPSTRTSGNRYGVRGPADAQDPHIARQHALRDAAEFGMIGLLNHGSGGDPNAPSAPWGRDVSQGANATGQGLLGGDIGDAAGTGPGIGGAGEGIGLGSIGTIGHGAGAGAGQGFGGGIGPRGRAKQGQGFGAGHGRLGGGSASPAQAYQLAGASAPPVHPELAAEAPIDPNGRFATTYRPGGGHLAAFESAVARGVVRDADREIVSDVGARYTPTFNVTPGHALGLRADLERTALPPAGGAFHLRLALRSGSDAPAARPHLSVHLVLDTSGSMEGESITRARQAAQALVDRLDPTDDFSLTTFESDATVQVPAGLVGHRRKAIQQVIAGLRAQGGTNIGEGLRLAYSQANLPGTADDAVRVVLLVSDGQASDGITARSRLARFALDAFQSGIQTSTFGIGTSYDGELMSAIASDGAGGYYYLRDPEQIAPALTTELERRLDPVASAVEVRVRLKEGVELLRVYGSRRLGEDEAVRVRTQEIAADVHAQQRDGIRANRHEDREGGMRFFMPAFSRDDSHALLFKLRAAPGVSTSSVATVELRYKDRLAKKNVTEEFPIQVRFADSDAASAATQNPSVARTVQGFAAGEALTTAALYMTRGDRAGAAALLEEREAILRQAAETLSEPLFYTDAARLARLRAQAGSTGTMGDPMVLAMLLETAGRTHLR